MGDEILLTSTEAATLCNRLREIGLALDQVEPSFSDTFLVLRPGDRAFSFLPNHQMDRLRSNHQTVQEAIAVDLLYKAHLEEEIKKDEARLGFVTDRRDRTLN